MKATGFDRAATASPDDGIRVIKQHEVTVRETGCTYRIMLLEGPQDEPWAEVWCFEPGKPGVMTTLVGSEPLKVLNLWAQDRL